MKTTAHEFISSLREKVLSGTLTRLSAGTMLFSENGVCITEDAEEEFVRPGVQITFIETEYAQQLSWVFRQFKDGIPDVILSVGRDDFYGRLADAANAYLSQSSDMYGLMLCVILEASALACQVQYINQQNLRDEVLACAASLSDVAEKL